MGLGDSSLNQIISDSRAERCFQVKLGKTNDPKSLELGSSHLAFAEAGSGTAMLDTQLLDTTPNLDATLRPRTPRLNLATTLCWLSSSRQAYCNDIKQVLAGL